MERPANVPAFIKALHDAYVARTTYKIRYNSHRERQWWDWCEFSEWEWTEKDLARVIHYLRSKINKDDRNEGALLFDNLIGNPPRFEQDLGLAEAAAKGNPSFQKKASRAKPADNGQVNTFGEEAFTGLEASKSFLSMLSNPPPEGG